MDAFLCPQCWVMRTGQRPLYAHLDWDHDLHANALCPIIPGIVQPYLALLLVEVAAVYNNVSSSVQSFSESLLAILSGAHDIL